MYLCLHFRFPNVIILTTSNVTGAIDLAFVDRYSTLCLGTNILHIIIYKLTVQPYG